MDDKKGYVKIYRAISESMIWQCEGKFDRRSAWIDLLLMANWKPRDQMWNGTVMRIDTGQIVTSQKKLAARWGWHRQSVKRFLDTLKAADMISYDTMSHRATFINIINYKLYQGVIDEQRTRRSKNS